MAETASAQPPRDARPLRREEALALVGLLMVYAEGRVAFSAVDGESFEPPLLVLAYRPDVEGWGIHDMAHWYDSEASVRTVHGDLPPEVAVWMADIRTTWAEGDSGHITYRRHAVTAAGRAAALQAMHDEGARLVAEGPAAAYSVTGLARTADPEAR